MPPYGECTRLGHLERLEHAVPDYEAVINAGNSSLVWIVIKASVQPDPELPGQLLRSGCGELHRVRLSATPDEAGRSSCIPMLITDTFGLAP